MKPRFEKFGDLSFEDMKSFLDEKASSFNSRLFIELDPVSIPHRFSRKEDVEIAAFLAATIAWGNRKSIITNASRMMSLMDDDPYEFVMNHSFSDLKRMDGFVHRTFNADDFRQFIRSLRNIYLNHGGPEAVFTRNMLHQPDSCRAITEFRNVFFSGSFATRTKKHVSDPAAGSSAKRLNMFLRWMVRSDNHGVDFGIWKDISPSKLSIPLDVHTGNIARKLHLLQRAQNDQKAVRELDAVLRSFDPADPVKYDFALFGLGAIEKF